MMMLFIRPVILFTGICFAAGSVSAQSETPFHYSSRKSVVCTNGAVVSAHPLASRAGLSMLKQGGNAIDAAVATQLALAVVFPGAGNLGGGGFMVARLSNGKNISLDFREEAPGGATQNMYLDAQGDPVPGESLNGHLACGVPGSVAGIFASLKYARLPIKKLIQPAIDLAEHGFAITAAEASSLNESSEEFKKYNTVMPVFVKASAWKAGDTLMQKDLAKTLRLIRDYGAKGFYEGETAKRIVEEMQRGNGLISYNDLKNYTAKQREPMIFPYKKEYSIVTMPLPSSGGVLLPQLMRMMEGRDLRAEGFHSVASIHLMTEAERLAYADRAKYLGDPDFFKSPVEKLISYQYLQERMAGFNPDSAGNSEQVKAGIIPESEETTHLDTYDKEGNAVSITTTLNNWYGCKTVVGGAGFFLNDEMDDFSMKPGVPNMFGAIGGKANAIRPGKRMLSSMTPTIVLKNDKPFLVVGTPGGTTIITSVFQTLINVLEFKLSPDDAVNKPKFHHQWKPDVLYMEKGFPDTVIGKLREMGYRIEPRSAIGRTELIQISPTGSMEAVADGRGDDAAEGY
ncbi:MAG: gamma-glutamyltransferase [Bacteroidota bacterium]|nr:gamma-glutamyltransferase [Bacteroidota bacterium]MDP4212852.1 gamma-glutamyltransferase [Bacteroidota bacterium]MDP4250358.1 gamma-glutamyltransferase [Bacteroidota bacterium]